MTVASDIGKLGDALAYFNTRLENLSLIFNEVQLKASELSKANEHAREIRESSWSGSFRKPH